MLPSEWGPHCGSGTVRLSAGHGGRREANPAAAAQVDPVLLPPSLTAQEPGLKPLFCGACWLSAPRPLVGGACLPACLHQFHRHSELLATSHSVARRFNYELSHFIHIYVAKAHRRQNTNKSPGPEKCKAVEQGKQGPKLVSFFSFPFLAKERMKQV